MPTKNFRYAAVALRLLEKFLGSNFTVSGLENLTNQPTMFVANHFTRSETFFVPYLIYKHTGKQVRCLADAGLYHGALGKFLESVGTISTRNKNRDKIILSDLVTGDYDWMIYPEGSMIKSKEIKAEDGFVNSTPYRVGPVRTGSAVLALKSQLIRNDLNEAYLSGDFSSLRQMEKDLDVVYQERMSGISTQIIPVNISYYPIRPGENSIKKLADYFVKKLPKQIAEELEIEGNLLLGAEINLSFGKPINTSDYVKSVRGILAQIPVVKSETKNNLLLRYFKNRLTNQFMGVLYRDLQINFDHLFVAALHFFKSSHIEINHLKRIIYLSGVLLKKSARHRLNHSIFEENLVKIFNDEPQQFFDSVFELALKQGIIEYGANLEQIKINKNRLAKSYDFHEIRLENSLHVILNEFQLVESAANIVKMVAKIADDQLRQKVFDEIYQRDLEIFHTDYDSYFDQNFSKDKSVGAPFFIDSAVKSSSIIKRTAILICHGYKSAPKEVEELAKFLNGFGFRVYATRMKGHGTAPINLKDATWQEWYDSFNRGYSALNNIAPRIATIGFSTGGLLALLSAANKKNLKKYGGLVSINSAIKLVDIKSRMVPGINIWNELLEKLHFEKGKFEYVDDVPENPHINYSRNYLKGVEQLENLMHECEKSLERITVPTLVIQGNKDKVVNPQSGKIIYNKISAKEKQLCELEFENHVIITGQDKEKVFAQIQKFLLPNKK